MTLTPAEAADLYRSGMSACQIAAARGITRQGAEARIRAGGLGGLQWCPVHRVLEELSSTSTDAVFLPQARWSPPRWVQPTLEAS